jgi:hypothetical protein
MVIIKLDGDAFDHTIARVLFEHRPFTVLGLQKRDAVALYDTALPHLDRAGITYRELAESDLQENLTPDGYAYYLRLKNEEPYRLFSQKIPEECFVVEVKVPSSLADRAIELIKAGGGSGIEQSLPMTINTIDRGTITPRSDVTMRSFICVTFVLQEQNFESLIQSLAEQHIAGFSRETMLVIIANPHRLGVDE